MTNLATLKKMRDELLERADAIDYCIRLLESKADSAEKEFGGAKKKRIGATTFSVSSRTEPAIVPEPGGVMLTPDELDEMNF